MLKHVVMFRIKDYLHIDEKKKAIKELKDRLDVLPSEIEQIVDFETGLNFSSSPSAYDLVLYSVFRTEEDLDTYRMHPKHQELLKFFNEIKKEIAVVDYWED